MSVLTMNTHSTHFQILKQKIQIQIDIHIYALYYKKMSENQSVAVFNFLFSISQEQFLKRIQPRVLRNSVSCTSFSTTSNTLT